MPSQEEWNDRFLNAGEIYHIKQISGLWNKTIPDEDYIYRGVETTSFGKVYVFQLCWDSSRGVGITEKDMPKCQITNAD